MTAMMTMLMMMVISTTIPPPTKENLRNVGYTMLMNDY